MKKEQNLQNGTEQALTIPVIIDRLKNLQKWCPWAGCSNGCPGIDWEEDIYGDWINVEDIEKLIKELESNANII